MALILKQEAKTKILLCASCGSQRDDRVSTAQFGDESTRQYTMPTKTRTKSAFSEEANLKTPLQTSTTVDNPSVYGGCSLPTTRNYEYIKRRQQKFRLKKSWLPEQVETISQAHTGVKLIVTRTTRIPNKIIAFVLLTEKGERDSLRISDRDNLNMVWPYSFPKSPWYSPLQRGICAVLLKYS